MFVALRDLRFARGRFVLIGAVVALITLLVGFLSGLTGGLAERNVSAVLALPGDRIVFSAPEDAGGSPTFADSALTEQQLSGWASAPGVTAVTPIGITQARAQAGDGRTAAVAVFGMPAGLDDTVPVRDGTVGVSVPAAEQLGVGPGDPVRMAGTSYTVTVVAGDAWFGHSPVVAMTLTDWRTAADAAGRPAGVATVLAVSGSADWAAADRATGTVSLTTWGSLTALATFTSEIGSLLLMVVMLFGISGLVVGAFFTVWTMQRKGDVAVLKALGAGTASLVRDALGQAAIVLVAGILVGLGLVVVLGSLAGSALPFLLSPLTTVVPGLIIVVLGLAGAAFALRSVTSADPLTALGSHR